MHVRPIASIFLTAIACLAIGAFPLRAGPITPVPNAACCAFMENYEEQPNDCGEHFPQSAPERQCCAACVLHFPLFASAAKPFVTPPANEESYAAVYSTALRRVEAPLVPPPRLRAA